MNASPLLLVSLPDASALAGRLATLLRCEHSTLAVHRFPDGESLVRFDVSVEERQVVLVGHLHRPDAKTLPLLFAADAARELGAQRVGLLAPYLPYMRQDQRFQPGEAVTARSYARLLAASIDFLVTVDPHLHRFRRLGDIYPIPAQALSAAAPIAQWLRAQVRAPLVVGPDSESSQWVAEVARRLDAPWTTLLKQRRGDHSVQVRLVERGNWQDRTPVLLDDIISTGETLAAATEVLRGAGYAPPLCIGVHALCGPATLERLAQAGVSRVVTCDTVPHTTNAIPLTPLLAEALRPLATAP